MITEPRILLLDEPIGALDYSLRETVMLELKMLQQRTGISFIWVTHDQNEAFSLGDLVVVMNHAQIEQQGTPRRSCSAGDRLRREASCRATTSFAAAVVRPLDRRAEVRHRGRPLPRARRLSFARRRWATRCRSRCVPSTHRSPSDAMLNRLSARCTTVEYFGAVRRHVFERPTARRRDATSSAPRPPASRPGRRWSSGWPVEDVLHPGTAG